MSDVKIIGPTNQWPIFNGNMKTPLWERRERIATAALQGLMADQSHNDTTYSCLARIAVKAANALITELDKPEEDKT